MNRVTDGLWRAELRHTHTKRLGQFEGEASSNVLQMIYYDLKGDGTTVHCKMTARSKAKELIRNKAMEKS